MDMNESGSQIVALTLAAALLGAGGMALWKKHVDDERDARNQLRRIMNHESQEINRLEQGFSNQLNQRDEWIARIEAALKGKL